MVENTSDTEKLYNRDLIGEAPTPTEFRSFSSMANLLMIPVWIKIRIEWMSFW